MSKCKRPSKNTGSAVAHCTPPPLEKIKLVELVEVVTQGEEKWVSGVGTSTTKITGSISRTAKDGSDYKQYINLDRDLQGQAKRHPDYGRVVELKARIEWENPAKKESLAGHTVYFSYELTSGAGRPAMMHADEKEGFGAATTTSAQTNADGWTTLVPFKLSMYGGDKFKLVAGLQPASTSKDLITASSYVVWRKFWYQMSHYKQKTAPVITKSIEAYGKVFAEMTPAGESAVKYTQLDLNSKEENIQKRTLYPEYMCITGSSKTDLTVVIGRHNEKAIRKFLKTLKPTNTEPIKMHYMMCDCQWDPEGDTGAKSVTIGHNQTTKAVSIPNVAIIKPALKGNLLIVGTWQGLTAGKVPNGQSGNMEESWIQISKPRSKLGDFKIVLPPDIVKKSTGGGIKLKYKLAKAGEYLGDSDGYQITIVGVTTGRALGNVVSTTTHETGHAFYHSPKYPNTNLPKSFNNTEKGTLKVYQDAGWHCSNGATPYGTKFQSGTCTMATRSNVTNREYCPLCRPFIRLQDISTGNVATPTR